MTVASKRRFGPRNSEISHAIMDATEKVIRDEGYAAVSSRRVAEVADIQQSLVYYYFKSMDDLLVATFQRRTERGMARYEKVKDLLKEEFESEIGDIGNFAILVDVRSVQDERQLGLLPSFTP